MLLKVVKRDGRIDIFNKEKIKNAIQKAFYDVDGEITQYAKEKIRDISHYIENINEEQMSVEEIQDIVEQKLMSSNRKDVAKAYIIYRNDRNRIREQKTQLMKDIADKLEARNV